MAYAINPWSPNPILLSVGPAGSYSGEDRVVSISGFLVNQVTNRQGVTGDLPFSVDTLEFDFFGNLISNQPDTAVNNTDPQATFPTFASAYTRAFGGTTYGNEFLYQWDSQNSNGTYNINYVIESVSSSGIVTDVTSPVTAFSNLNLLTPTAIEQSDHLNDQTKLDSLGNGNVLVAARSLNSQNIENIEFEIVRGNGSVVVPSTTFTDPNWTAGNVYNFELGTIVTSSYALFTVDTSGTGASELSSLHLWSISTTGAVSSTWTQATNFQTIDTLNWVADLGDTGLLLDVTGTTASGYDHQLEFVSNTNGQLFSNGLLTEAYTGTVTEGAEITGLGDVPGSSSGWLEYWVDGNGLTMEEIGYSASSGFTIEDTYNISSANGTATVTQLGDGRIEVEWQVVTGSTAQDYMQIFDLRPSAIDGPGTPVDGNIAGTIYNDFITHSAGIETINGGGGLNTYDYASYTFGQLAITHNPNGSVTVVAPDGTDTLYNIQLIQDSTGTDTYIGPQPNDFTGDGNSDILFENSQTGQIWDYQTNGAAVIGGGAVGNNNNAAWQIAATGYFGGGTDDILFQNSSNGQVYEWQTNGTSVIGSGVVGNNTDPTWKVVGTADLAGNGVEDVLFQNTSNGQVYEWALNGTTVTSSAYLGNNTNSAWQVVGTGDFTGNGNDDILFQNSSSGQVYEWEMNGTSVVGSAVVGNNTDPTWKVVGTGDFAGNGVEDVLFQNINSGQVYEWALNGTTVTSSAYVGNNTNPAWQVVGIGDYNGDGKSDILFQNATTGQLYQWLMNGTTVTAGAVVGNNTNPNFHVAA